MLGNVKGKVTLITGAASGIVKHMAEKFAEYGSAIVIADLNLDSAQVVADAIKAQYNVETLAVAMDVTNEEQVNAGVKATVAKFNKLDVVISNAGIQTIAPIVDFETNAWKRLIDIHLHGTFLVAKASMQQMIAQKTGGRVLVTGSIHSVEASKNKAAYVAAKHAQLGFVRSIAEEGAPHNISANLLCPGFVRTPLVEKQIPEQAKTLGITEEQVIKNVMLGDTVDGEFTTLDDVANVALFLAGFETNALTGQHVLISHGIGM
jgi:3-hydroxybutyrate dehydrogenase